MACQSMVAPTSKIASASKASASTWSSFGSMRVSQCGICNFRALQSVETGQAVQPVRPDNLQHNGRSEEHTSELQSLMRISYAVFCLKKKNIQLSHELIIQASFSTADLPHTHNG